MTDKKPAFTGQQKKALDHLSREVHFSAGWEKASRARAEKIVARVFQPGRRMPDGTIYLGFLGNQDWYVAASDECDRKGKRLSLSFDKAARRARDSKKHGHNDWRLPPGCFSPESHPTAPTVLDEMFNRKNTGAFLGTYAENSFLNSYTSSTTPAGDRGFVFAKNFKSGGRICLLKGETNYLRLVRAVPCP